MKKTLSIITVLFSVLWGALPPASAATRYTENWGTGTAAALGNGSLPNFGWIGIAQSQTAQPYLGIFAASPAPTDSQLGTLPANTVYFSGLTGTSQTNGPGMFYTTTNLPTPFGSVFTNLDPVAITNLTFNVEVVNAGGNTTNYFAVFVGSAWYVALNNPLPVSATYTNWTMVYVTNAAVWNNLTIDGSLTFVTIGGTAGADLSGPITGVGIVSMNNTNITGTPGLNYNRIVINQGKQDFPVSPATNSTPATQPLAVYAGGAVTFAPGFGGTAPLVFNWQTNGVNIGTAANIPSGTGSHYLGASTTRLTITNITVNDITNFSVVCTNLYGAATNSGIVVYVVPPPPGLLYAEIFPTVGFAGNNSLANVGWVGISTANSAGGAGGGSGVFANNGNGNNLVPGTFGGSTADEFTFGTSAYGTNACYTTTTNDFGNSGLPFPVINPASYPAVSFQCAFAAGGQGLNGVTTYWMVQMSDSVGGTTNWYSSSSPITILGGYATNQFAFSTAKTNWNNLTITGQLAAAGSQPANDLAGNITGAGLLFTHTKNSGVNFQNFEIITNAVTVYVPNIGVNYPIDLGVPSGGGASFGVAVSTPASPPFTYDWTTNGVPAHDGGRVSGSTTATLTIANVTASDNNMQIVAFVTNSAGFDESDSGTAYGQATTLTVTNPPVGLVYSEQVPFVGPVGGNYSIGSIGWAEAVSGTPFTVFRRGTAGTTSQGDGAVFAFLGSANTTVYYTTSATDTNQSGLPFPNINLASYTNLAFSVDIAPNSASSTNVTAYLAVQLNGANWYVATTPLLGPNAASNSVYSTYTMAFNPTAALWNNLTVTPGTGGTIGSAAASKLSGVMTGAGLVFVTVNNGGTFNFDNFIITGTGIGGINASLLANGNVNLSWVGNPAVNLQSTTNLTTPNWQDVVPSTLGLYSLPVSATNPPQKFFRMVQH
jgi:hypothetical protein